ncbi:MAG TPA: acyl-CoA dehydrogenase, partial [Algoriphagus sp.]|nr:acyl-CoA dehydrogenase [Algoriphagus sp.]
MIDSKNKPKTDLAGILNQYRDFVKQELFPIDLKVVQGPFKSYLPQLNALREKAKKLGLFAPHLSEKEGGLGLSLLEFAHVSEILGQSPLGHYVFNCNAPDIGNMELLHLFGSDFQKEKFLKP